MRRDLAIVAIAGLSMLLPASILLAEDAPGAIRWRHDAGPAAASSTMTPQSAADLLASTAGKHLVVQFKELPGPLVRARLARKGLVLQRYLGDFAFFASVDGTKGAGPAALAAKLHRAHKVNSAWKLHAKLIRGELPAYARIPAVLAGVPGAKERKQAAAQDAAPEELAALYVIFHEDVDADTAAATVAHYGGSVRSWVRSINMAVVWVPSTLVQALAQEDAVQWIEPPLPPFDASNDSVRSVTQADSVQSTYALTGSGVCVLVYDGGTALSSHLDFGGRLAVRDNSGTADHPTHVAGTIGGSGASSAGTYRGMAPGVTIQSFGFQYDGSGQFLYTNPGDMEADYDKAINTYGALIANNSIGTNVAPNGYSCDWEGDYGATDMLIDAIVRGSLGAPMRVIWANGNERGSGRCGTGYRTTAPPACAKNHFTVGAINSYGGTMTTFSSWGPADDGRLKPDICAPGCQSNGDGGVTSTVSSGGYGVMCGTSMAAPAVTGLSALLLQDWMAQFPAQPLPSNAMLKILLAHNAVDLGPVGPDFMYGYGSVRIQETIDFVRTGTFTESSLAHGEQALYFIPITATDSLLKLTLAWDDAPGAVNTIPELVNDLDIKAIDPSGTVHYPWTLDPANPSLNAVRTKADHLNNLEQVLVENPQVGTWTVMVSGFAVPSGPQNFALASTPNLRFCSSAGLVVLDLPKYSCGSTLRIKLSDCDLDTNSQTIQTTTVNVVSGSEPAGEAVLLTESAPGSASFVGTLPASSTNAPGSLWINHGDSISATYIDADDGHGGNNVSVSATATTDCLGPIVANHQVVDVTPTSARILFTTDEPAKVDVRYGASCATATTSATDRNYETAHSISVAGLTKNTPYYYKILTEDEAGNQSTLDNSGQCFQFTTLDRQNFYTQLFDTYAQPHFDLNNKSLVFKPSGTIHKYTACLESISVLPVDPAGSTVLPFTVDDSFLQVTLAGGMTLPFYGQMYSSFFVGSNGYITFDQGDNAYDENIATHFTVKRISVLFDDFSPQIAGSVKWRQLSDRVAITWDHVPQYNWGDSNTFQVVIGFDGTIQFAWLGVNAPDGLVGLSEGGSTPEGFQQEDLSTLQLCAGLPFPAFDPHPIDAAAGTSCNITLSWARGVRTVSHEIFLSTSAEDLVLQAAQTSTSLALPLLENGTTYYWRVDELNVMGRTTGSLWSFGTQTLKPDFDLDGDVDMVDYAHLQLCFSGTDVPQLIPECLNTRMDADQDVDLQDAQLLEGCLSGSDHAQSASCLP